MLIYLLVALFATIIGSAVGLGGGVIIKPMLDLIGDYNVVTISILSSVTVLSMATVATFRQIRNGFKVTKEIIAITIGAIFGGVLGSIIFGYIYPILDPNTVTVIQSSIIAILLIFCLFYNKMPKLNMKSVWVKCIMGLILGMLSSFLGIGGGPINVAALVVIIGFEIKDAAKVSVFIILFSQIAGLASKAFNGILTQVEDLSMLYVMIPAAIIGGILGSQLNIKMSDKVVNMLYKSAVMLVILICAYNIYVLV